MPDMITNWEGGAPLALNSPWPVETSTPAEQKAAAALITDTLESAGLSIGTVDGKLYVALISKPQLAAPSSTAGAANVSGTSEGVGSLKFGSVTAENVADKLMEGLQNMLANADAALQIPDNPTAAAIQEAVAGLSDAAAEKLDSTKTPEQVKALLLFAMTHPDAPVSPAIREAAAAILQTAEQQTGQPFDASTAQALDGAVALLLNGAFTAQLEGMNLPPEIKNLLSLAASIPALADALPQDLKAQLAAVQAAVAAEVGLPLGVPEGWLFTASAEVEMMSGAKFDQQVMGKLQGMVEDGSLSRTQFNELRSAYFSGQEASSPVLQGIVDQLKSEMHIPAGYRFPVDSEPYHAMLNGATFAAFKERIGNSSPPLSPEQQAQLMVALGTPDGFQTLPPELKAIFTETKGMAIAAVVAQYNLPINWQPDVQALAIGVSNIGSFEIILRQNVINMLAEMLGTAGALLDEMKVKTGASAVLPQGTITSYMDAVSSALLGLQEQLNAVSTANAQVIRRMNVVNKDTTETKLEKQRKELADVKAAHTKQQIQAVASQYGIMVGMIVLMVLMPFLIPMVLGLMMSMIVMMAAGAAKGMKLDATHGPFELAAHGANMPVKMIWVLMSVLNPLAMMIMGLIDLLFTGGKGIIEPALKAYGVPASTVSKVLMGLQMASIAGMILMMVAFAIIPGLQPLAAAMAEALGAMFGAVAGVVTSAAVMTGKIVKGIIEGVIMVLRLVGKFLTLIADGLKLLGEVGMSLSKHLAELGKILIGLADDATAALNQAIIDAKKLIHDMGVKFSAGMDLLEKRIGQGITSTTQFVESSITQFGKGVTALSNKIGVAGQLDYVVKGITSLYEQVVRMFEYMSRQFDKLLKTMGLDQTAEMRLINAEIQAGKDAVAKAKLALPTGAGDSPSGGLTVLADRLLEAQKAEKFLKSLPLPRSEAVEAQVLIAERNTLEAQRMLAEGAKVWANTPTPQHLQRFMALEDIKAIQLQTAERTPELIRAEQTVAALTDDVLQKAAAEIQGPLKLVDSAHAAAFQKLALGEAQIARGEASMLELQTQMANTTSIFIEQFQLLFQGTAGVIQAGWAAYNKVLQGQIALIKAAYEAYAVEVEAFLKILQAVLNKLMAQLQDLGDTVKRLIDMQYQMVKGMSDSMTRLSSA